MGEGWDGSPPTSSAGRATPPSRRSQCGAHRTVGEPDQKQVRHGPEPSMRDSHARSQWLPGQSPHPVRRRHEDVSPPPGVAPGDDLAVRLGPLQAEDSSREKGTAPATACVLFPLAETQTPKGHLLFENASQTSMLLGPPRSGRRQGPRDRTTEGRTKPEKRATPVLKHVRLSSSSRGTRQASHIFRPERPTRGVLA